MTEPDLFSVLDRATEGIEPVAGSQRAAVSALARARTVRTRRRGLVAGAVAAVAVLVVVVATGVHGTDRSAPVAPSPAVPEMPDSAVQATWDPRAAGDLPQRPSALPAELQPPSRTGRLPLTGGARLVLADRRNRLYLLGKDGSWASTQGPAGAVFATLSDDGTMLAAVGDGALWVTDVRDGTWRKLAPPPVPGGVWNGLSMIIHWRGNSQIVVAAELGYSDVWVLHVDGGSPTTHPFGEPGAVSIWSYALAPNGQDVLFGRGQQGNTISEVNGGEVVRTLAAGALGNVWLAVASDSRVAGVVAGIPRSDRPTDHAGIVVLDRDGYAATGYLPIAGSTYTPGISSGEYSAGVAPIGWLDDQTVLLTDSMRGNFSRKPWSLVAWNVESGALSRVSAGSPDLVLASVARDLIGQ